MRVVGRYVRAALVAGALLAAGCQSWPGRKVAADKPEDSSGDTDRDIVRAVRSSLDHPGESSSGSGSKKSAGQAFGLSDKSREIERNLGYR